jgi:divalent metal cation (Fe/Co/Zn/Cd) transporter
MGSSFYVDLHIVVNGDLSVRQGHKIAHEVENRVLNGLPQIAEVLVHVEPQAELIGTTRSAKHLV